jgi:hypothetical protein
MTPSMCQDRTCPMQTHCDRHASSGREAQPCQAWILPARKGTDCDDYLPARKEDQ